jgi:hypothetical protein
MIRMCVARVSCARTLIDWSRLRPSIMLIWGCLLAASVAAIMMLFGPAKKPVVKPRAGKQAYRARPADGGQAPGPTNQQIKRDQGFGRR